MFSGGQHQEGGEKFTRPALDVRPNRVEVFRAKANISAEALSRERRLRWIHGTLPADEEGLFLMIILS